MIDISESNYKVLEFLGKAREELGNNADRKTIMKRATYLLYSSYFDVIVLK